MAKVTLTDLANLDNPQLAVSIINANMDRIATAIDSMVSRDGTAPNSFEDELDMNGQRIINLPVPVDYTEPARHGQLQQYVDEAVAAQEASETAQGAAEGAASIAVAAQAETETARDEAVAAAINVTNFDLIFFSGGIMENNEVLFRLELPRAIVLPASLTNSRFSAGGVAAGSTTVTLKKNGSNIGTLVWAPAGTVPTVTFASQVSFAAGDVFSIHAPATADVTLADVSLAFVATRS